MRDSKQTKTLLSQTGLIVIITPQHVRTAEHLVTTVLEVHQAGFIPELTFRLSDQLIHDAIDELNKRRDDCPGEHPLIIGAGSILNSAELVTAVDLGFDFVISPGNITGTTDGWTGCMRICQETQVLCIPAFYTPTELQTLIEGNPGYEPDVLKLFPAHNYGPDGVRDVLSPFLRPRHEHRTMIPTGGITLETAPAYWDAVRSAGFAPALAMTNPLKPVIDRHAPGDAALIRQAMKDCRKALSFLSDTAQALRCDQGTPSTKNGPPDRHMPPSTSCCDSKTP